jgi:ABC-type lipoprotein export system ATPase subunit
VTEALLQITNLSVELGGINVLNRLNLSLRPGEVVAVVGASGSGKSTLLHAIAGFISEHTGSVRIGGQELSSLSGPDLCELRRTGFGLMTQDFHLLRKLSARKNVMVPQLMAGIETNDALRQADNLLLSLGLGQHLNTKSENLSRGQRQRVAFARSISHRRPLLILDEPTSSLDRESSRLLLDLVSKYSKTGGAVLLVTHDESTIEIADHVYNLENGSLLSQGSKE